jgi:hypothetical protein
VQYGNQSHEDMNCISPNLLVKAIVCVDFRTGQPAVFSVDELIVIESSLFHNKTEPSVNAYWYIRVNQ